MGDLTPQTVCLSCGLCCDGTLFDLVPLQAADVMAPLQIGGIEIQVKETKRYFKQPCAAHRQGCCQVYADRPANCRKFRCELLKKYESGTISLTQAQQTIGRAQALKDAINAEFELILPEGRRISVIAQLKLVPARPELAADPHLRKAWAPVMLRLSALLDCLQTHFKPPPQQHVQ